MAQPSRVDCGSCPGTSVVGTLDARSSPVRPMLAICSLSGAAIPARSSHRPGQGHQHRDARHGGRKRGRTMA